MPSVTPEEKERRKRLVEPLLLRNLADAEIAKKCELPVRKVQRTISWILDDWYNEIPHRVIAKTLTLPRWDYLDRKRSDPVYIHRHLDGSSYVGELQKSDIVCTKCGSIFTPID